MRSFVISLPGCSRRERIAALFAEIADPYEFVDAIAGAEIVDRLREYCPRLYSPRFKRELMPNEVGCSLSHRLALQRFLETGESFGLILEDDAVVDSDILRRLDEIVREFAPELLKVGGHDDKRKGHVVARVGDTDIYAVTALSFGAHAYVVSRAGAHKLVRNAVPVRAPYDAYLHDVFEHGCYAYETMPWLVDTDAKESTMGYHAMPKQHARPLVQLSWQLRTIIMRPVFNVRRFGVRRYLQIKQQAAQRSRAAPANPMPT